MRIGNANVEQRGQNVIVTGAGQAIVVQNANGLNDPRIQDAVNQINRLAQQVNQMRGPNGNNGNNRMDLAGGGLDPAGGADPRFAGGGAVGPASGYLFGAIAIMKQITLVFVQSLFSPVNAIVQLAKNLTAKDLAQQGKALTEAGMAEEVEGNSSVSQQLRLVDAQLATMNSVAETNIKYWEEVVKQDFVKGPGQSADLAKPA